MDEQNAPKKTRRKRRVPGTDKPPRKEFVLRLEVSTLERLDTMLATFMSVSRNEYIERLIVSDLEYRDRMGPLNFQPGSDAEPPPLRRKTDPV